MKFLDISGNLFHHTTLISSFIRNYLLPMDLKSGFNLRHLRRFRKVRESEDGPVALEIVLCSGKAISHEDLVDIIAAHPNEITAFEPRMTLASKYPAYCRSQFESFSVHWPVTVRTEAK